MPAITILDGYTTNPGDLDWKPIQQLGKLKVFDRTPSDLVLKHAKNADIIITNKVVLNESHFQQLPKLKCIAVIATGYNNIDVIAARNRGIVVCNAVGYSAPSVAQHVFALLLELTNKVGLHNQTVQKNGWANSPDWSYCKSPIPELQGKTMGIYGLGAIGEQVANIALGFGMKVIAVRKSNLPPKNSAIRMVNLEQLFLESDVLSLHSPLTEENKGIINEKNLSKMKKTAILINTGRGGFVIEADLKKALESSTIAGAALDVLIQEPPVKDHILLNVPNCIITPHHAWAAKESRIRLIEIVADNIKAFLDGNPKNVV